MPAELHLVVHCTLCVHFYQRYWNLLFCSRKFLVYITGILLPAHIWAGFEPMIVSYVENLHNRKGSNSTGAVAHVLVSPSQGLCSKPRHQSKRDHVPLRWCAG